jgi:chemotaxis protein methyltransferase CheR
MAGSEDHGPRAVRVTPEDVRRLCEFLYRRTGMLFDDNKRYYIDRRLVERIGATKSESFQAYFAVLRSDADHEIEQLINAFTVNETYFNREEHQLRCMTSDLPATLSAGRDRGNRSASGRYPARPGRNLIRLRFG